MGLKEGLFNFFKKCWVFIRILCEFKGKIEWNKIGLINLYENGLREVIEKLKFKNFYKLVIGRIG